MNGGEQHLTSELADLLDSNKLGTIATVGKDGRPHLSVVYYANQGRRIFVSTLRDRLKATHVERTGWAALSVRGEQPPYPSATFSGPAIVRATAIAADTALIMGRIAGLPQPAEPQSEEALAAASRVLIEIAIERVTAISHL